MEDAEIVELLLDGTRDARKLLEVVGGAARTREALEAGRLLRRRRNFLLGRMGRCADIDAGVTLRTRDSVDRGARDEVTVERDGAAGVVVARHHIGDTLRVR